MGVGFLASYIFRGAQRGGLWTAFCREKRFLFLEPLFPWVRFCRRPKVDISLGPRNVNIKCRPLKKRGYTSLNYGNVVFSFQTCGSWFLSIRLRVANPMDFVQDWEEIPGIDTVIQHAKSTPEEMAEDVCREIMALGCEVRCYESLQELKADIFFEHPRW